MKQYLDLVSEVFENGTLKGDRTGTGTKSIFGHQTRYNLQDGFPLVTTKKVHFKSIVCELLWFLRGDTNIKYLKDNVVSIWDAWADENGDLGPIYGAQLRRWDTKDLSWGDVLIRQNEDDGAIEELPKNPLVDIKSVIKKGKLTGFVGVNGAGCEYIVLGLTGGYVGNHKEYTVQFLKTGFITNTSSSVARAGNIKDNMSRSLADVGYIGDIDEHIKNTPRFKRLHLLWRGLIQRCYCDSSSNYKYYGGVGVTVSKRWHCLSNFIDDISTLYGYESWSRNELVELDKDYYGSTQYSRSTCLFISKELNVQIQNQCIAVEYDGVVYPSLTSVGKKVGASRTTVRNYLINNKTTKNKMLMRCELYTPSVGYVCRPRLAVDQINNLISEIKNNPYSRRHVVSMWNPADMECGNEKAALSSCHLLFQFYVSDGKLSCQLYQRSADLFLGVPFNIASYALLVHMIAQVCGLEVGDFIHTIGDAHIYLNHIDQVEEQLSRTPLDLPTLNLNVDIDDIDDYTIDDIKLENYIHYDTIKGAIAV